MQKRFYWVAPHSRQGELIAAALSQNAGAAKARTAFLKQVLKEAGIPWVAKFRKTTGTVSQGIAGTRWFLHLPPEMRLPAPWLSSKVTAGCWVPGTRTAAGRKLRKQMAEPQYAVWTPEKLAAALGIGSCVDKDGHGLYMGCGARQVSDGFILNVFAGQSLPRGLRRISDIEAEQWV